MSDNMEALVEEIAERLRRLGPDARTPDIRAVRREYSRRLRGAPAREVVQLARLLLEVHGRRDVAYELLFHHKAAFHSLTAREIEELGAGMASWGAVDCYGAYIAGPAWSADIIDDETIHRWARSPDRWWRRAALVSTVYLNDEASRVVERALPVCRVLAADRDDMVVKALSWALRSLIRYDRKAVEAFLSEHHSVVASRVKREVRDKLETGLKNPPATRRRSATRPDT